MAKRPMLRTWIVTGEPDTEAEKKKAQADSHKGTLATLERLQAMAKAGQLNSAELDVLLKLMKTPEQKRTVAQQRVLYSVVWLGTRLQ